MHTPKIPKPPPPPPPAPQVDEAAKNDELVKKFGRRRGRLATMYAGAGAAAPSVAMRSALGIGG